MVLPVNPDLVENISDLFNLFESRWPMPKPVIFRGESKEYLNFLCPSAFRDGKPSSEFEAYEEFHSNYYGSSERDYMFDKLHPNANALHLPFVGLAQHYGVHTRLLDVTLNPLVALYFSASSNPNDDGYIFFFIENFLDLSPYNDFRELDTIIASSQIGDYHPQDDTCLFFRPEWPNARIAAQHGAFILTKGFRESIWNGGGIFKIPSNRKPEILTQLHRFGVTYESLFPELKST